MWEYIPETDTWISRKKLPSASGGVLFCTENNGFGYVGVSNGNNLDLWRYDPINNAWKLLKHIPVLGAPAIISGGMISHGNYIYFSAAWGATQSGSDDEVRSIIQYDLTNNTWKKIGDSLSFVFFIYKDNVYAVKWDYKVSMWDNTNNIWIEKASIPTGINFSENDYELNSPFFQEHLVSADINGEPLIGTQIDGYFDYYYDVTLWFKYSER